MGKDKFVIGGEFEISPSLFQDDTILDEYYMYYSSGRAALYHILCALEAEKRKRLIFLPDYICESVVNVVTIAKWEIHYYPVLDNLKPDLPYLLSSDLQRGVVLFINYFGGIDLKVDIQDLKKREPSVFIIEDNVQSLFSMYTTTEADAVFTSFRKTLPLPDGGWVKTKSLVLNKVKEFNSFAKYKAMGGVLKKNRLLNCISDEDYLRLFKKGEDLIDSNLNSCISDFSLRILSRLNLHEIASTRQKNAFYLVAKLKEIGIISIIDFQESMVPLFVPVKIADRDYLRHMLFDENIYCPCHWPCSDKSLKRGVEMAEHELSLIIDQRYDLTDMDRIVDIFDKHYERVHY